MYSSVQSYISIQELSDILETQLSQISALYIYSKIYEKHITIPNQNEFIKNTKLFDEFEIHDYHIFNEEDNSNYKIIPFRKNIMLSGKFESYKKLDDNILEKMRNIVYHNEEYMYEAYRIYNNIKEHFNANDEDIASLYYEKNDNSLEYYKKSLIIINKKNIVVFSPNNLSLNNIIDNDYNVYYVWHDNIYVRFILLSFFQHNIIQFSKPFFSLWASYISKYQNVKNIVVPEYLNKKINKNINNINFVYLS